MFKIFRKFTALGILAFLGAVIFSCEKQDPMLQAPTAQKAQNSTEKLIETMANDELVKAYLLEEVRFAVEYNAWCAGLDQAEKIAHREAVNVAARNGTTVPIPSHTEAQLIANNEQSNILFKRIEEKYPEFPALSGDEQNDVLEKVTTLAS